MSDSNEQGIDKNIQEALAIGIKIVEGHNATKIKVLDIIEKEPDIEIKKMLLEYIIKIDKSLDDKLNSVDDIEYKVHRVEELIQKQIRKEKKNSKKMEKREKNAKKRLENKNSSTNN